MNQEQVLGIVRWVITTAGAYAAGKGWLTADQITLLLGVAVAVVPLVWTLFAHKQANLVATVAAMPEVAKVETVNTAAGRDLAATVRSTPEAVVTVAPYIPPEHGSYAR